MTLIECPLKKKQVEEYECYELSMASEGLAPKTYLSKDEKEIGKLKKICLDCPNHRND
ncbi:hypothetical protein [Clostridium sp.]|jgi:hypothetical protein|uniref:hypothetical protein n=1 Tax=Clostridium sp. TaxID=1506 RepID=UPI0039F465DC